MNTITRDFAAQQLQRVLDGHEHGATMRAYHQRCGRMSAAEVDQVRAIVVKRLTGGLDRGPDQFRRDLLDAIGVAVGQVESARR